MKVSGLDDNVVVSGDGGATAILVLDAGPASVVTFTVTPTVIAVISHHHHGVAVPGELKSYSHTYKTFIFRYARIPYTINAITVN